MLVITGGGIMVEPVSRMLAPALGQDDAKRISAEAAEAARQSGRNYAAVLAEHSEVRWAFIAGRA
ncbi:hypothetical protein ELY33_11035 [Vreelandella andesensis]|uniref:Uncharacterized protein n=1 Tax=Vreelandella andesensis TaxID=447567 RepID=A0A3S1DN73_9GAMM|nr:hypothetical protein [Halomonas andesensis]RUR30329.1 hypothetical protein ELY33_11035 [Halomonas andesensis]